MASILYRLVDGNTEEIYVEYDQFEAHLSAGWSADDPRAKKSATPAKAKDEHKVSDPVAPGGIEMTDDEVRDAAKAAGIRGWHNTGVDKLREKLAEQK